MSALVADSTLGGTAITSGREVIHEVAQEVVRLGWAQLGVTRYALMLFRMQYQQPSSLP